ncbi:kinesin-like protein KIN-7C, partial [Nymphaea colorata]
MQIAGVGCRSSSLGIASSSSYSSSSPPAGPESPLASGGRVLLFSAVLSYSASSWSDCADEVFDETCTNLRVYERYTKDVNQAAVNGFNVGHLCAFPYKEYAGANIGASGGLTRNLTHALKVNDFYHDMVHQVLLFSAVLSYSASSWSDCADEVFDETCTNLRVYERYTKDVNQAAVNGFNEFGRFGWFRAYSKTGAGGIRLKEGKYKNKSLMALVNVINRLSDSGVRKRGHIPYRDSKLTAILQPALGGNAKTSIICTVAPEEVHVDETRGTLQSLVELSASQIVFNYEAWVIYNFLSLCVAWVGGPGAVVLSLNVGHLCSFPYKEYAGANIGASGGLTRNLTHALKVNDFYHDTVHQ